MISGDLQWHTLAHMVLDLFPLALLLTTHKRGVGGPTCPVQLLITLTGHTMRVPPLQDFEPLGFGIRAASRCGSVTINAIICRVFPSPISSAKTPPLASSGITLVVKFVPIFCHPPGTTFHSCTTSSPIGIVGCSFCNSHANPCSWYGSIFVASRSGCAALGYAARSSSPIPNFWTTSPISLGVKDCEAPTRCSQLGIGNSSDIRMPGARLPAKSPSLPFLISTLPCPVGRPRAWLYLFLLIAAFSAAFAAVTRALALAFSSASCRLCSSDT